MRILLIADIHANWPALSAIDETFDACLFLGDLVDYGTAPARCIDWVRLNMTAGIRGNHDHALGQRIPARGSSGFRSLAAATRPLHFPQVSEAQLDFLRGLPVTRYIELDQKTFYLVHGTPRDPLDEYLRDSPTAWTDRLRDIRADFVCVGHTHIPFHLELGTHQVINPGSVGQPRDGDPRAAYAIVEDGRVTLHRVEYDIDAAVELARESGLGEDLLEMLSGILQTGGQVRTNPD